jgi:hypothetical protein
MAQEHLVKGGQAAVEADLPGAPTRSIDDTPRPLHVILDDWRLAEREAGAAADAGGREEARKRADGFREEYRRAFADMLGRTQSTATD